MFNMWILAKYRVILRAVGINCIHSSQNHTAPLPLHSHTLIESNCCCHNESISEPATIKIIWLRAWARYYCWRASFQIWTRLTIEHFSTLKRSILNEPWPTGHDSASGPCSHMASFLHDRALAGICRWHGGLCLPTVVSGSIPGPI